MEWPEQVQAALVRWVSSPTWHTSGSNDDDNFLAFVAALWRHIPSWDEPLERERIRAEVLRHNEFNRDALEDEVSRRVRDATLIGDFLRSARETGSLPV